MIWDGIRGAYYGYIYVGKFGWKVPPSYSVYLLSLTEFRSVPYLGSALKP